MKRNADLAILTQYAGDDMMALRRRNAIAALIMAVFILLYAAFYLSYGHIVLYLFSNTYHVELSYKNMKRAGGAEFILEDFKINAKNTTHAVRAKSARIIFMPKDVLFRDCEIAFRLIDGFFLKKESRTGEMYVNLTELVGAPFCSEWRYREISGKIKAFKDGVEIKDFMAVGDDIKLSANGSAYNNSFIDFDIVVHFSDNFAGRMPEQLSKTLLTPEGGGWSSLFVHLKGNYEMPSMQVTSKLFRLNIKNVSEAGGEKDQIDTSTKAQHQS